MSDSSDVAGEVVEVSDGSDVAGEALHCLFLLKIIIEGISAYFNCQ